METAHTMEVEDRKELSREDVREKLIVATLKALEEFGVAGVRARDLAKNAGCAVGTIYNLVGDLDDLVLLACARTLEEFKDFAIAQYEKARQQNATQRELLTALAGAYIDFARNHKKRWQANFEISFDENSDYFHTYVEGQVQLLNIIASVLKDHSVGRSEAELFATGRALWASVHGISMLAMSNPSHILPRDKILEQCHRIIDPVIQSLQVMPVEHPRV